MRENKQPLYYACIRLHEWFFWKSALKFSAFKAWTNNSREHTYLQTVIHSKSTLPFWSQCMLRPACQARGLIRMRQTRERLTYHSHTWLINNAFLSVVCQDPIQSSNTWHQLGRFSILRVYECRSCGHVSLCWGASQFLCRFRVSPGVSIDFLTLEVL